MRRLLPLTALLLIATPAVARAPGQVDRARITLSDPNAQGVYFSVGGPEKGQQVTCELRPYQRSTGCSESTIPGISASVDGNGFVVRATEPKTGCLRLFLGDNYGEVGEARDDGSVTFTDTDGAQHATGPFTLDHGNVYLGSTPAEPTLTPGQDIPQGTQSCGRLPAKVGSAARASLYNAEARMIRALHHTTLTRLAHGEAVPIDLRRMPIAGQVRFALDLSTRKPSGTASGDVAKGANRLELKLNAAGRRFARRIAKANGHAGYARITATFTSGYTGAVEQIGTPDTFDEYGSIPPR